MDWWFVIGYIAFITAILAVVYSIPISHTDLSAHACALFDFAAYAHMSVPVGCAYADGRAVSDAFSTPLLNPVSSGSGHVVVMNRHGG